jgi:hypothetical protein
MEYYYQSETENGSPVKIKEILVPRRTAWSVGVRRTIFYVDLNEKDLEIQKSLGLPNWRWDFTGKGLVLEKGEQDWGVTQTHLDNLKIKTPWKHV